MKRELTILLLLIGIGCAQQSANKETSETPKPALRALGESVTSEEVRSDEAMGVEIRDRLNLAGVSDTRGVIVNISDGVVTLSGSTQTLAASWRAEAAAQGVKGVKKVLNRIIVPSANR